MLAPLQNAARHFAGIVLAVLVVSHTGCKPKEQAAVQSDSAPSTNSLLQRELTRLLPLECDPAKRPLILSRPAANRRDWVLRALVEGYEATGRTNAVWDEKVRRTFEAYADYSRLDLTNWPALRAALTAVLATGCDDPMICYLRARYPETAHTDEETAIELLRAHSYMVKSAYHPVFKFFSGWRAFASARPLAGTNVASYDIPRTTADLEDLARDTNAPVDEVFESARNWLDMSFSKLWIDHVLTNLESILIRNWDNTEQLFHLQGDAEIWRAWGERGGGWSSSVTDKGWEGFTEHMEKAEQLLTRAWQMNSNSADTAYLMMQVELGQGRGRSRMEDWFSRAISLDTNYFDAVKLMSFYLEPRWYGSERDTLRFARSCVASDTWGGRVPLVLADVHHSLATYYNLSNSPAYWRRPKVWADVKSSYEKFFAREPDAVSWRHDYAMDAYNCGQYSVFLEQTKLFAYGTNFTFFGGREKFQEMLQKASAASGQRSP